VLSTVSEGCNVFNLFYSGSIFNSSNVTIRINDFNRRRLADLCLAPFVQEGKTFHRKHPLKVSAIIKFIIDHLLRFVSPLSRIFL